MYALVTVLFQIIGQIFHVSQAILGITVLAWGNSVSDWVADILVAKKGYPGYI